MKSPRPSILILFCLAGCAAEMPVMRKGSDSVQIRKGDPPDGYTEIGPVSASHGSGCGAFGVVGSYEGAMAQMKNVAVQMRADFVRLDLAVEPHFQPGCRVNEYIVRGVAFRRGRPPAPRDATISNGPGQNLFQSLGGLVGQRVVVHLKSGEILAGTLATLTPPDDIQLVLLDQTARKLHTGEIDRLKPAP